MKNSKVSEVIGKYCELYDLQPAHLYHSFIDPLGDENHISRMAWLNWRKGVVKAPQLGPIKAALAMYQPGDWRRSMAEELMLAVAGGEVIRE